MSRTSRIEASLDDWNSNESEELIADELLMDVAVFKKEDSSITFKVDPSFTGEKCCSLVIPNTYPSGEYSFFCGDDDMAQYRGDSINSVMEKIFKKFRKERTIAIKELITPTPTPTPRKGYPPKWNNDDDEEEEEEEEGELEIEVTGISPTMMDNLVDQEAKNNLDLLINEVNKMNKHGIYCVKGACGFHNFRVYLVLDPSKRLNISDLIANCWGVDLNKFIVVSLTLTNYNFHGMIKPEISSFQAGDPKKFSPKKHPTVADLGEETKYGLWWTICFRLLRSFFQKNELTRFGRITTPGKFEGKNFLLEAAYFVERTLQSAPYYCIVCGSAMEHVGVKPSVCHRSLCIFSHEEYGLGCDLDSEILNNSEIVDMLICMTFAAAAAPTNKFNPFEPFPRGIEVKRKDEKTGEIVVLNFMDSGDRKKRDNKKVLEVVTKVPPLKKLRQFVLSGELKKRLDKIDIRMYSLLRWIITSNRCHLHKLSKTHQIKKMNTDHQYIMMSGTAEKEAEFLELKEKYGSIKAWHGSPLFNWHAILRKGLKNMSNTKGQIHGKAYGAGVYFAKDSGTSTGYMKFHSGWANSKFSTSNSLGMMSLCEIVKHPNYNAMPNPYYVIPDESHIQTRLFFVYSSRSAANLMGSQINIPKIKWWNK